jgi:hypothetical protein
MSFLQPILLAALPLVALPIIIHLINQRRYQTIRWGHDVFVAANRISRGYSALAAVVDRAALRRSQGWCSPSTASGWLGWRRAAGPT